MKYISLIIAILFTFSITSCVKESFEEVNPALVEVDTDGEDLFMKGTYNGQPFEVNLKKTRLVKMGCHT
jgi:hypothetical protein